ATGQISGPWRPHPDPTSQGGREFLADWSVAGVYLASYSSRAEREWRMADGVLGKFRLDGEAAVVTGAARGIGRAVALGLAEAGARVAVADLDLAEAKAVAKAIREGGGEAMALALDVADEAAVDAGFAEAAGTFGGIRVLVNNAGTAIRKPSVELPRADWDK